MEEIIHIRRANYDGSQLVRTYRVVITSGSRGGGTEAMASPKRQTREAKLCFGLPQTGQWVYLVSTESTDFTGFVTKKTQKNCACGARVFLVIII